MSLTARTWARDLKIGSSTLKTILKELGDFEQGTGEVYAHIATLVEYTDLDRKTVVNGLQELIKRGHLADTGKRVGRTKQIPVYKLVGFDPDFAKGQRADQERRAKSPKIGTVSPDDAEAAESPSQVLDDDGDFPAQSASDTSSFKQSQNRNRSESGTVPFSDGNSPVFPGKQSQKRDTNSSSERVLTRDARAPARERARAAAAPAEPPSPEQQRRVWRALIHAELVGMLKAELRVRCELADMPFTIREAASIAIERITDRFATAPHTNAIKASVRAEIEAECKGIPGLYREGVAA